MPPIKKEKSPKQEKDAVAPKKVNKPKAKAVPEQKKPVKQSPVSEVKKLKLSLGQRLKHLTKKDFLGTVKSVKNNEEGFAIKITVLWDSGAQNVVTPNSVEII